MRVSMRLNTGHAVIDASDAPYVCGSDEVGLGAWAGPMAVCAVAVPAEWVPPPGLTDSKAMSTAQMARARKAFLAEAARKPQVVYWRIWWAGPTEIDCDGAGRTLWCLHKYALEDAAEWARKQVDGRSPLVVADGNISIEGAISLPKADKLVPAVSMAAVLAKLARDERMVELGQAHPGYGFEKHVGYGTKAHQEALARLGVCPIHRRSYAPIAALLPPEEPVDDAADWWASLPDE